MKIVYVCGPHPFALTQLYFCLNKASEVLSPVFLPRTSRKSSMNRGQQINRKHGYYGQLALFTEILNVNAIKALICGISAKL